MPELSSEQHYWQMSWLNSGSFVTWTHGTPLACFPNSHVSPTLTRIHKTNELDGGTCNWWRERHDSVIFSRTIDPSETIIFSKEANMNRSSPRPKIYDQSPRLPDPLAAKYHMYRRNAAEPTTSHLYHRTSNQASSSWAPPPIPWPP